MSPIESEIVIEIEWPSAIYIDFEGDVDLDHPNYGMRIFMRLFPNAITLLTEPAPTSIVSGAPCPMRPVAP